MQELLKRKKGLHRSVLIVDDELIEREMLKLMLSDLYEVFCAEDGEAALDIIMQKKQTLSLILLDLHMPKLDGYSILKIMRSDSELRNIPIIVLTAEKKAEVKSLQMGAADFIPKPYDAPDVVKARIQHSIELAEDRIIIHETERDELTGLYNRRGFELRSDESAKCMKKGSTACAMVIDMDGLKRINDRYGHAEGDIAIKNLADIIGTVFKDKAIAGRTGGDEFYVFVPECTEDTAAIFKKQFYFLLSDINNNMDKPYELSASFGTFVHEITPAYNVEELLRIADERMYAEKQQKRAHRT